MNEETLRQGVTLGCISITHPVRLLITPKITRIMWVKWWSELYTHYIIIISDAYVWVDRFSLFLFFQNSLHFKSSQCWKPDGLIIRLMPIMARVIAPIHRCCSTFVTKYLTILREAYSRCWNDLAGNCNWILKPHLYVAIVRSSFQFEWIQGLHMPSMLGDISPTP